MVDYLLSRITMGTIINFRYSRSKTGNTRKDILVLTPNYLGNLHGLKIIGLTQSEQEYLQLIFKTLYTSPNNFFEPLIANLEFKKQELEVLNNQKNQLIQQSKAVVMKPQTSGFPSVIDKGKQVLGSIVGKITTFGRTQTQAVPAAQINKNIMEQIQKNDLAVQAKKAEFDQYAAWVKEQQKAWKNVGPVPRDPYMMYHKIIKPLIGFRRMPDIYRKYNVAFIQTPRITKSPGIVNEF